MTRTIAFVAFLVTWNLGAAQDLVITNARILDGTGHTIDQGSIVVSGGRIVSVSSDTPSVQREVAIDAQGMTVMPGLIDTHRHLFTYWRSGSDDAFLTRLQNDLDSELQKYLEAGFTTVMSVGDYYPAIMDIKRRIDVGELMSPRLLVTGPIFTAPGNHPAVTVCADDPWCRSVLTIEVDDPSIARAKVRELADADVDAIKVVYTDRGGTLPKLTDEVLAAIDETAQDEGLLLYVHAESVEEMLRAVELGTDRLVHVPRRSLSGPRGGSILREAGITVATTTRVLEADRTPERLESQRHRLRSLGQFRDDGVIYAFGTDHSIPPDENLLLEIETLSQVLSPQEIITALTRNAATHVGLSDEIGVLEAGKIADIVIVEGDPPSDISDLANVKVVIQGGQIVVDNR